MLNATASVQVTIVSNYYTAKVDFYNGPVIVYTVTLIQQAPIATLPPNLDLGTMTFLSGSLMMQLPSPIQTGTVTLNGTYTTDGQSGQQTINAVIASWSLNQ